MNSTIEGAAGHEGGRTIGGVELFDVLGADLTKGLHVAAMAIEGLHEQGEIRVVLHNEVKHHLVEVWAMIAAVTTRAVHHCCSRLLSPLVAAIDLEAGPIEMATVGASPRRCAAVAAMRRESAVTP